MAIEKVDQKNPEEKGKEQQPLLRVELPMPMSGDPNSPITIGTHNACAQKNFKEVANVMMKIINNQKLMAQVIEAQAKEIKELRAILLGKIKGVLKNK